MLRQTFCHIQGIGKETERALWAQGCSDWQTFLDHPGEFKCGTSGQDHTRKMVEQSVEWLANGIHQPFQKSLGQQEAWRAWPEFRDRCLYLDIETDGGNTGNAVTIIGLYDGQQFTGLVKGRDLESFRDLISHASMIVTFFGSGFDVPMLHKRFKGLLIDQIHLDLCFALKRLGYKGGLKKIEQQLGISRGDELTGLNGLDAIRLWRDYSSLGKEQALDQLIAYNREDVVNLERLAEVAYQGLKKQVYAGLPELSPTPAR